MQTLKYKFSFITIYLNQTEVSPAFILDLEGNKHQAENIPPSSHHYKILIYFSYGTATYSKTGCTPQ